MPEAVLNTHGIVMEFGKHAGQLLTRVPVSYLFWMVNQNEMEQRWRELAKAELDRRGSSLPKVEISGHAIDSASLRVRKIWHQTALDSNEGLHSWLQRITVEAIERGERRNDKIIYLGMKLAIMEGEEFPVLKTIMPAGGGK